MGMGILNSGSYKSVLMQIRRCCTTYFHYNFNYVRFLFYIRTKLLLPPSLTNNIFFYMDENEKEKL